ncbi:hypothetical protein ES707_14965 [subsurface metagenome]
MPVDIRCPICGSETVLRIVKRGLNVGKEFYVCKRYPDCKGKVPMKQSIKKNEKLHAYEIPGPTLVIAFCIPIINRFTVTPRFGRPYMRLIDIFRVEEDIYMTGAILGRSRSNNITELAKLLFVPGTSQDNIDWIIATSIKDAQKNLDVFINKKGREPDTFDEFTFLRGLADILKIKCINMGPKRALKAYSHRDSKVRKVFDARIDLEKAELRIKLAFTQGICFGSSFPELTERMYNSAKKSEDAWLNKQTNTWAYGLTIPEELNVVSIEESENNILELVALYASKYRPELVASLELEGFLESSKV